MVIGIDASRANARERTGTERYSFEIIRAMVKGDRETTFVLYLKDQPLPDLQNLGPNVTIRILRWPPRFLWNLLRLSWEMLRRRPDVLFVPAHIIPLIHPGKTVVTLHDVGFERFPELYEQTRIGGNTLLGAVLNLFARIFTFGRYGNSELDYHRWSARFAVRHASFIITVSEFSKTEIASVYGIPKERIAVVHHGFDHRLFQRPVEHVIEQTQRQFSLHHPYILFTGRLEKKKNILGLIQAFALARERLPELELVLIGREGYGWDEAQTVLEQRHLMNAVHVLGWQPEDEYLPLLAGAKALVVLSHYEGFGLPILEAFAVGTPVVVANAASLPEVSGPAALLVPKGDEKATAQALIDVVTNASLRKTQIKLGRERLASFTWDRAAATTLDILLRA